MNIPWFVYPAPCDGHLGYFLFGAVLNKVALIVIARVFVDICILVSVRVELLSHKIGVGLKICIRNRQAVFQSSCTICLPFSVTCHLNEFELFWCESWPL